MTVFLSFYSLGWDELSVVIGCRDRKLYRKILDHAESELEGDFEPEDFEGGPDFEEGLDRWIQGEIGSVGGTPKAIENLGDALAFRALVDYLGRPAGTMSHSATSGKLFLERVLEGDAAKELKPPFPIAYLLSRPILSYESASDLTWGGLNHAELESIAPGLAADPPSSPDLLVDEFLPELWNCLGSAVDLGNDLVTIYG